MDKPVVFLSHSSADKAQLVALKELLDKRAAGALEFFLSSDGQSIRFGRNWVVGVSDALSKAKLMFVFLSPSSADSKWIHFEAGCAYANRVQVVPVCLAGMDLNQVTPPLSLLQGFNLHSAEAMSNLARTCNEVFQLKMEERFTVQEFASAFSEFEIMQKGFFRQWAWAIDHVSLRIDRIELADTDVFEPLPILIETSSKGLDVVSHQEQDGSRGGTNRIVEFPGCVVKFFESSTKHRNGNEGPLMKSYGIEVLLSPELFHINAPHIDEWHREARLPQTFVGSLRFRSDIAGESERYKLTTLLYQSGIRTVDNRNFEFSGFRFSLGRFRALSIDFGCTLALMETPLPQLIGRLFDVRAIWQSESTPSVDYWGNLGFGAPFR